MRWTRVIMRCQIRRRAMSTLSALEIAFLRFFLFPFRLVLSLARSLFLSRAHLARHLRTAHLPPLPPAQSKTRRRRAPRVAQPSSLNFARASARSVGGIFSGLSVFYATTRRANSRISRRFTGTVAARSPRRDALIRVRHCVARSRGVFFPEKKKKKRKNSRSRRALPRDIYRRSSSARRQNAKRQTARVANIMSRNRAARAPRSPFASLCSFNRRRYARSIILSLPKS